jgi:hypothetical protein
MKHIKTIEDGHEYQIIDRSNGEFGNSCSLRFIKIMGGEVIHGGAFTQDVLEALRARVQYQIDNETDDPLRFREGILSQIENLMQSYAIFTEWRKKENQKLIGHKFD